MKSKNVIIFDTTLRDGEQTPGINLNISEKVEIAKQLEILGVDIIEAGFPATSKGDFQAVEAVSKLVNCSVAALSRCVTSDIDQAWQALRAAKKPRIHLFIATSSIHMEYKLKMTPGQVLERAIKAITHAKGYLDDIEFSCEDASRSEKEFLYKMVEAAINAGATTINIPDTVGYAMPEEFGALIAGIKANVPNIEKAVLSVHCHNDLGLAGANTVAALQNGAQQAEVTVNGIGERSGNCSLEELVMAINTRPDFFELSHQINTKNIYRTSQLVSRLTGISVSKYKPIVGENAFAHESGIHQHGMLENPMTYEIMTPESVGKKVSTLVLGKHSGRHAFINHLEEMGYRLTEEELNKLFDSFKTLADRKKSITDEDIEALMTYKLDDTPIIYGVKQYQITCGNALEAMASISLSFGEETLSETATGEGPIDAAYNAINRAINEEIILQDYTIKAVTGGEDALGEVKVRIQYNNRTYTGKGLALDIIESSIKAYIDAINRMKSQILSNIEE